ncbi:family 10 glycosylhydrolase [Plectonema cf. radiosum LEGE 06105]|uniref:Family 10 glycosylhydrolase n=1 Tax=Plectonema cf. radiosum LEGE 06105 TaxID=945769 RepID=A0A8J7F2X1_9CYAN|nr:family 10 glycosylhydrolase [Plectonema radiosum]MBE9212120.1 family 10 glycosylhydrolase [Plectonema cf. radiosum LEGE 06105]
MSRKKQQQPNGCGCLNIPVSVILLLLGGGYWLFTQRDNLGIIELLSSNQQLNIPLISATPTASPTSTFIPTVSPSPKIEITNKPITPPSNQTAWEKKAIRGIYLSRYHITNNASENMIREKVRYYRDRGFNTIIHGVWGNACTMYKSEVMQQTLGFKSCPNLFEDKWLDWLIDEAHKQGMEVHAYFEKGIKIDKNSPIFDLAISRKWIVPGVDKTYAGIEHYVLDVEIPEVADFFQEILVEFVKKYPKIDAVQWDDYLGYHADLPGKVNRTAQLTNFLKNMINAMKQVNPSVSFDICHHNPYWAKQYFAADYQQWKVDRIFIQAYNESGFAEEVNYAQKYNGIAINDKQFHRIKELINNPEIKSILVFPLDGKPEETASKLHNITQNIE